jgi:hypothetical protein
MTSLFSVQGAHEIRLPNSFPGFYTVIFVSLPMEESAALLATMTASEPQCVKFL